MIETPSATPGIAAEQKPAILAVDDEPAVLAAVARDLRREYGAAYRVLRADSGAAALDALRELRLREEPVALLVVDQRMPGMTGVDLLREAIGLHPDAKRVLLTAYADTEAAIRAINEVRLDHYLMKPWDPPEERLFPVLTDLLDDWRAGFRPPFDGLRVVGHRWSAEGHRLRDFLTRNLVPFRWLDVESDAEAAQLVALVDEPAPPLPLVVFPDGTHLASPSNADLAARIGLRTRAVGAVYDLVIVGAGPAGLASAVYGASEGLRTLIVERQAPGGQAGMSARIENYLGFPVGLSGADLARRAVAQAARFGAEILTPREARALRVENGYKVIELDDGSTVAAQALLIATGVSYRMLDLPGADRLLGLGVYYGAAVGEALDAAGRDVFVIGGGNSAGQAAIYLARFARSVTMLVRGSSLAATTSQYLVDRIAGTPNIAVRTRTEVSALHGERALERITLRDQGTGQDETHDAHAIFVFIGALPRTEWLGDLVERDGAGYILTGPDLKRAEHRDAAGDHRPAGWDVSRPPFWLETSVPGVFAAGDVRHRSVKRVASAVGEGAMAVQFVHQHLGVTPVQAATATAPLLPASAR